MPKYRMTVKETRRYTAEFTTEAQLDLDPKGGDALQAWFGALHRAEDDDAAEIDDTYFNAEIEECELLPDEEEESL